MCILVADAACDGFQDRLRPLRVLRSDGEHIAHSLQFCRNRIYLPACPAVFRIVEAEEEDGAEN